MIKPKEPKRRRIHVEMFGSRLLRQRVIFVDIDGVICNRTHSYRDQDIGSIREQLGETYNHFNDNRILKVYQRWSGEATATIKRLCDELGAKIVISSSWRKKFLSKI